MQEQIRKELKQGKTVETVCKEYDLTFEQLFHLLDYNKLKYVPKHNAKNITHKNGHFTIVKVIDGERYYFGQYLTLEDAVTIRNELKKANWDKNQLKDIQIKTGIALKGLENTYIRENNKGNWTVTKVKKGKKYSYGTYKTLREAKLVRDELVKAKWDSTRLDEIVKKLKVRRVYPGGQPKGLKR